MISIAEEDVVSIRNCSRSDANEEMVRRASPQYGVGTQTNLNTYYQKDHDSEWYLNDYERERHRNVEVKSQISN